MVAPHSLGENGGLLFVCKGKEPAQDIQAGVPPCKQPLPALVPCAPQESSIPGGLAARAALTCRWHLYVAPFGEISDQRYHHPDVHSCADGYGERGEEESSTGS